MKKFVTLVLSLLMMLPLAGGVAAKDAASYNLSDVTNALKYVAGWGDGYYSEKYDSNADGKINTFDVTRMLKIIADWDIVMPPPDGLLQQIENDFAERGDRYPVKSYYGIFNDCVPIMFMMPEMGVYTIETVAGVDFHYGGSNKIRIWKDGEFFYIKEAYEQGILTKDQVAELADIHGKGNYIKY